MNLQAFVKTWNSDLLQIRRLANTSSFQKDMVAAAKNYAMPQQRRHYVGASELHKPLCFLGLKKLNLQSESKPSLKLRHIFWTGHMFEALIILMMESYGLDVTDQQLEVSKWRIYGHIDCIVNGDLVEIKTMSPRYFNQFAKGNNDERGYRTQLDFYASLVDARRAYWLCFNKETTKLAIVPQKFPAVRAMVKARELSRIKTVEDLFEVQIPAPKTVGRKVSLPFQYVSPEDWLLFYDSDLYPRPQQERAELLLERANAH